MRNGLARHAAQSEDDECPGYKRKEFFHAYFSQAIMRERRDVYDFTNNSFTLSQFTTFHQLVM